MLGDNAQNRHDTMFLRAWLLFSALSCAFRLKRLVAVVRKFEKACGSLQIGSRGFRAAFHNNKSGHQISAGGSSLQVPAYQDLRSRFVLHAVLHGTCGGYRTAESFRGLLE